MRRRQLADRVAQQEARTHPQILDQPVEGDLQREQRALGEHRLIQWIRLLSRSSPGGEPPSPNITPSSGRPSGPSRSPHTSSSASLKTAEVSVQLPAHPHTLSALAGEQERDPSPAGHDLRFHHARRPAPHRDRVKPGEQLLARAPPSTTALCSSEERERASESPTSCIRRSPSAATRACSRSA